jgi:outer membrane protein OmpA-like peptidoglycan-associated protein
LRTFAEKPEATQQHASAEAMKTDRAQFGQSREVSSTLHLQRTIGNQGVQPLPQAEAENLRVDSGTTASMRPAYDFSRIPVHSCAPGGIQPKLMVNTPGDIYEQEADRISEHVVRIPEPQLQRACACGGKCADCRSQHPDEGHERLQRKRTGPEDIGRATAPPIVHEVLSAPGQPLDPSTRGFMEPRFGHDLSHVRIHTDRKAAESARAVKALAYTVGNEVVFGEGEYLPRTLAGRRLLAHELVHTLQQNTSAESADVLHRQASLDIALRSPTATAQALGSEILYGFELNSHTLTAEHLRRLLALAERLKQLLREHQLGTVEITGHTDATGDEALNDQLGQDRADAVAAFLRRAGVRAVSLLAESAGESALRVPTDKPEPRNRRVEIRFLPELPTPSPPPPESLCTEHPEICDPITTKLEAMPSCSPTNCSAVSVDSFDKQPPDLRLVLTKSFQTNAAAWFEQLEPEHRMALTQIFNRMCQYGVWCHVRLVLRIEAGERPLKLAGHSLPVYGSTPSVFFTSPPGNALLDALMATGRFCMAFGTGASEHPGQTTVREVSGSDSLHISLGPGDTLDAHIDRYSPVPDPPGSAFCPNEPTPAAVGHIGREVVPGKVRKGVGTGAVGGAVLGGIAAGLPGAIVGGAMGGAAGAGGFQVFPDPGPPAPVPPGAVGPEPFRTSPEFSLGGVINLLVSALLESSRITVQGPLPERPEPLVPPEAKRPSPDVAALEAEVITPMTRELEQKVSRDALLPSRVRVRRSETQRALEVAGPDEEARRRKAAEEAEAEVSSYADAHLLGLDLAARMEQARINGEATARLVLGPAYGGLDDIDRRFIAGAIRTIALIVRKHLPDRAAGVRSVIVLFGVINDVTSEVIDLPE